jgi:hypothetical protein
MIACHSSIPDADRTSYRDGNRYQNTYHIRAVGEDVPTVAWRSRAEALK